MSYDVLFEEIESGFPGGNSRPDPENDHAFDSTEPPDKLYEVYTGPGLARDNTRSRVMPDPNVQTSYAIDSDDPAKPDWVALEDRMSLMPLSVTGFDARQSRRKSGIMPEIMKDDGSELFVPDEDCEELFSPKYSSSTKRRPNREGALNLKDIKPGLRVVTHPGSDIVAIRSKPYFYNSKYGLFVRVWSERLGFSCWESLAHMGVVPYSNGLWHDTNYTTLAPPKRQKLVVDSGGWDDSIEFFNNLGVGLRRLAHQGKQGEFEVSVPHVVRDAVPPQVVDRYKTARGIVAYLVHD